MKDLLPARGIEVVEIPRLELGGAAVSASMVRRLIREGNTEGVRDLVPGATARFLASDEGQGVIQRIRASQERH
jgi:[citrate (pro-3S)-lyase] ligase